MERRGMSLSDKSEPKAKTVWVCPQCGWVRPEDTRSRNCGKCNSTLVPKIIKAEDCISEERAATNIIGFTEEYRNKYWRKCRYGKDLRDCPGYYSLEQKGEFQIYCKANNKPCDAKWTGEKDE